MPIINARDLSNPANNLTLSAASTALAVPNNLRAGATYVWKIKQDATGGRTITFPAIFKHPFGVAPLLSTGPNAVDILTGLCDGTNIYLSIARDFK